GIDQDARALAEGALLGRSRGGRRAALARRAVSQMDEQTTVLGLALLLDGFDAEVDRELGTAALADGETGVSPLDSRPTRLDQHALHGPLLAVDGNGHDFQQPASLGLVQRPAGQLGGTRVGEADLVLLVQHEQRIPETAQDRRERARFTARTAGAVKGFTRYPAAPTSVVRSSVFWSA